MDDLIRCTTPALGMHPNQLWMRTSSVGKTFYKLSFARTKNPQAEQAAEKVVYFVIPSEARNLSLI
jgi:hypothetical protein